MRCHGPQWVRSSRGRPAILLALALAVPSLAQDRLPEAIAAWDQCRARADSLEAIGLALVMRADSLATARDQAARAGRADLERQLLARSEAVAESLRAVRTARLGQDLLCEPLAGALRLALAQEGSRLSPDSLLRLEANLRRLRGPNARAGFTLPEAGPQDTPGTLRLKAAHARDLADRAGHWTLLVIEELQRREDMARVAREAGQLLGDEAFLDESGGLAMFGLGNEGTLAAENPAGQPAETLLGELLRGGTAIDGSTTPEEMLEIMRQWLEGRREELRARATELEQEAERREREP